MRLLLARRLELVVPRLALRLQRRDAAAHARARVERSARRVERTLRVEGLRRQDARKEPQRAQPHAVGVGRRPHVGGRLHRLLVHRLEQV